MNFNYLEKYLKFKKLYEYCMEAEEFAISKPSISAVSARKAMEFVVKMIYSTIVTQDYGFTVFDMMTDVRFINFINSPTMLNSMHFVRKMGNTAAHGDSITQNDSLDMLKELHFIVGEFSILIGLVKDYPEYVEPTKVQTSAPVQQVAAPAQQTSTPVQQSQEQKSATQKEKVVVPDELVAEFAAKMRETEFQIHHGRDEAENKKLFLKASLREAGWPIVNKADQAMPSSAGINMLLDDGDSVDYVLYGRDNRPLAIIEYTTTVSNLIEGRRKAIEKADKMEIKYGYKPVAYYTNGYHIYVIDQLGYKPRRVFQFHSLEELELFKVRATNRQDISNPQIDENIAGRDYQKQAITNTCKAFMQKRRHSLLVMATGTGKTRISIALSDVLLKAGWAKNILFLADRNSLVRQAHKNFTKLLPNVTTSVYSGASMNKDANARIIFSTYQTMINLINDDTREFGIGRFDLIIIDEAHRSIFKKYSALFHYFDALMVGLTATPRSENNKSTYEMFELPNGHPDYAYELEQAIKDGFLVGFSVLDRTTDALKRGICYDDLTEEEKEMFEDAFASGDSKTDFSGTTLSASRMHDTNVINLGTIDAMLNDLMKNGLKVNGGDQIGKTIIFAKSHLEAEKIVERFQKIYAHLGLDFCKLIDSQIVENQELIDTFGERDQLPQIAVSVDMMDTGIDVPDVLNLVYFRKVNSKIKFLQMVGRGTRLSKDIFGPGRDKQGFLALDYYDNFRYFRTNHTWSTVDEKYNGRVFNVTPISILINKQKLGILQTLSGKMSLTNFEAQYKDELRDFFINSVRGLCNDDIEVQYNMAFVSKYRTAEQWDKFDDDKVNEITTHILPLIPAESDNFKVKSFDLLIYIIENQVPKRALAGKDVLKIKHGFGNVYNKLSDMLCELLKLKTIPAVMKKEVLIKEVSTWRHGGQKFSLEHCESVRKELRKLMTYIPNDHPVYIIQSHDTIIDLDEQGGNVAPEKTYAEKAQEYIIKGSVALAKIRNLDDLTQEEKDELNDTFKSKLGSDADYAAWSQNKPLLAFLRVQVGIADEAIKTKFGSFLNTNTLTPAQLQYMEQIISYTRENGDIAFLDLQRVSPLCDVDIMGLFGTNISYVKTLINGLHRPVM